MQFESLKVFCDLAESESFSKAARINGVTQSAVSQTVSALEKHFKSLLVERSKKNFRLTAEGDVLYAFAKSILQSYGAIQSKMQELKGEVGGEVRVSAVYSIGLHDLPPYEKRFLKEHPQVKLQVQLRRENLVHEDVVTNLVDFGLVVYPSHDSQIDIIPLRKDPLVVICHPGHPLAKAKKALFRDLSGQKFVSFELDLPTRKVVDKMFKEHGVKVVHALEFDNIEILKRAVENGSGLAIVGEETIRQEVADRTLVALRLEGNPARQLGVIHKKGKVLSPAMKAFIALLKEPL